LKTIDAPLSNLYKESWKQTSSYHLNM